MAVWKQAAQWEAQRRVVRSAMAAHPERCLSLAAGRSSPSQATSCTPFPSETHPSQSESARSMPARGRAVLKLRRVWRRGRCGHRYPSPSPRGFPLLEEDWWGLLRKPSIMRSKVEGQPPPRGRGLRRSAKHRRQCRRFALFKAASLPPRPCPAAAGRCSPTQGRGSVMRRVVCPVLLNLRLCFSG